MRRKIGSSTWTKKSGSVRGAKENWFGSGKELVREVFEYQRPKLKLVRYWQMSYKCPACHKKGRSVIVRASVPKPLLNHSLVAASVVAEIMYQKYVNAMPLYRQEAA